MNHLSRALEFALSQTWAMEEGAHRKMMQVLHRHAASVKLTEAELEAAVGGAMPKRASEMTIANGVATIPIHGIIAHRASAVGRVSSRVGTSVEHIRADLQAALGDASVQAIVLDVDSPGGSVAGVPELGEDIRAAREKKPILAHTDGLMASAGYWLASQADQVFATPSAIVGSIGVISSFYDDSRVAKNEGFDPVVVKSVPAKGNIQTTGGFGDAERADVQREVDAFHAMFVEAVANGRGITLDEAKAMGDGRVHVGKDAEKVGLTDGVLSTRGIAKAVAALVRERAAAAAAAAEEEVTVPDGNVADPGAPPTEETVMTTKKEDASAAGSAGAPEIKKDAGAGAAAGGTDQMAAERARQKAIYDAAADAQGDLVKKLILDGTSIEDALRELNADLKLRLAKATQLPHGSTDALGGGNKADVAEKTAEAERIKAMPEGIDKLKAEFAADKKAQAEFADFESYAGWRRNEANVALARRKGRAGKDD